MEQEQLAPLPRHVFDTVPDNIRAVFDAVLQYRVDPAGEYYGVTANSLMQQINQLSSAGVVAIDVEPGETKYKEKGKMFDPVLQSFVMGCGGQIGTWNKHEQSMAPAVFRGVTKRKEMKICKDIGRDFYYIDTGYFGNGKKKTYHRITKNDVQNFGPIIDRPGDRVDRCNIQLAKFRKQGSKVLIAPPSQKLLNLYNINLEDWLTNVQAEIKQYTDRPIDIRLKKGRAERVNTDTMEMALADDVYCLVTFSSIAAGEALLLGKPAITLGPNAAAALCSNSISEIENIKIPTLDEVAAWCRHISYCQFTEVEMRDGTAWRILNGG
jgi:hypothetical protein